MKILIDIGHPAHVHYFRNFIKEMEHRGHEFLIVAKDRSVAHYLLDYYKIKYIKRPDYPASVFLKLFKIPLTDIFIISKCLRFRPNILMGFSGTHIAHAGWLLRTPSIVIDDTDHAKLAHASYSPFASVIITPKYFRKDFGKKHIKFDGSTELFYLHPDYYVPNDNIYKLLGIEKGRPYILIRFVRWHSSHDLGQKGLSMEDKIQAVKTLSISHKVFISSEAVLPDEIAEYQINIPPERMHDVLYYADLFFGESGTMATEAAFLGTPAVDIATSALLVGVFEPFIYSGLLHVIPDGKLALQKALEIIKNKTSTKKNINEKKLFDNFDLTKFLIYFTENYPDSFAKCKENDNVITNNF
jgi:predicted glycosyltransferase